MDHALYLHIPFCRHRCAYCDFNTYAGMDALIEPYMRALVREIRSFAGRMDGRIATIFLGGGTPSLVPPNLLAAMFEAIRQTFALDRQAEVTLEANPGTVDQGYLDDIRALGVNRLSMGMQSASPDDLRILERGHDFFDVAEAVRLARRAGFENLNLDLIFGLPYQSLESWQRTLELAIGLRPEHFSVYNLILEHGTPMKAWVGRGLLPAPDEDLAADMYEHAQQRLPEAGYLQYEISNWSHTAGSGDSKACRHNLVYWRGEPYLGLGAGAHGYAAGVRTVNVRAPRAYIERMADDRWLEFPRTPATVNASPVGREDAMAETMMTGLRLVQEGVADDVFRERFGSGLLEAYPETIQHLVESGLLEWNDRRLRLTRRGVLLGNRVFVEFVG